MGRRRAVVRRFADASAASTSRLTPCRRESRVPRALWNGRRRRIEMPERWWPMRSAVLTAAAKKLRSDEPQLRSSAIVAERETGRPAPPWDRRSGRRRCRGAGSSGAQVEGRELHRVLRPGSVMRARVAPGLAGGSQRLVTSSGSSSGCRGVEIGLRLVVGPGVCRRRARQPGNPCRRL
jgi:hypothetical protein